MDADPVEIGGRLASRGKKSPSPGRQDVKSEKRPDCDRTPDNFRETLKLGDSNAFVTR